MFFILVPILIFIIELLVFFIIEPFTMNQDFYATLLIIINIPFVLFLILKTFRKELVILMFIGFFIRISMVYVDVLLFNYLSIPHSGIDSVAFYNSGKQIMGDPTLFTQTVYGGLYSKFIGIIMLLGSSSRIIIQYINVLFSISTIIIVYKIMNHQNVKYRIKKTMLIIMVFFPSSLIFSSILLRESIIAFIVTLSFYFFLKWFSFGKIKNIIYAFVFVLLGAVFHSGIISILFGYLFMIAFYRVNIKRFQFTIQTFAAFLFIFIVLTGLSSISVDNIPFLSKIQLLKDTDNGIYELASTGRGDSTYLDSLEINNFIELILFAPIKMIYFLATPIPIDWRGIYDVFTFTFDSLFYIFLFGYPLFNYKKIIKKSPFLIALFIILLSSIFLFGISLNNTGTAMRHRFKFFYLLIIFFSITLDRKNALK